MVLCFNPIMQSQTRLPADEVTANQEQCMALHGTANKSSTNKSHADKALHCKQGQYKQGQSSVRMTTALHCKQGQCRHKQCTAKLANALHGKQGYSKEEKRRAVQERAVQGRAVQGSRGATWQASMPMTQGSLRSSCARRMRLALWAMCPWLTSRLCWSCITLNTLKALSCPATTLQPVTAQHHLHPRLLIW